MDDGMLFLIVAVISITVGYLAGSLLSSGRDRKEDQEPAQPAQPQFPADALHIWRDNQSKKIVLQVGKRIFRSGEPLPPTEGKHLAGLIAYLQRWLGIPASPVQAPSQTEPQPAQLPQSQPVVSPFTSDEPEIPYAEKSIVGQIDDILQEKITNTPLRERGIRLMENLDGSMRVMIGLDQFEDVSSIPDETVKAAIRAAVQDWEQRQ
ncbi:MAG: hypothetical protein H8D34_04485 [Chloroflexi bacterium]|nr:hypothetical protein [Chloroflexota bacterium]